MQLEVSHREVDAASAQAGWLTSAASVILGHQAGLASARAMSKPSQVQQFVAVKG